MPSVPPLVQEREREDQHEKLLPWHYKLAKLIDCEIYQASEDATRKDPLLLALIDFSRVYTHFLVSNTADYNRPMGRDLTPAAGHLRGPHRATKRPDPISETPKPKHRRNPKCTNKQA